jgi:hypothetical protein
MFGIHNRFSHLSGFLSPARHSFSQEKTGPTVCGGGPGFWKLKDTLNERECDSSIN